MEHDDLPERWAIKLQEYLRGSGVKRGRLSAEEFRHHLKLSFEDRWLAFFYYAFYLSDESLNEVAVFTEHCGYHIFPLLGTQLKQLESKCLDGESDHFQN